MNVFEQCELRFDYQYISKSVKDAGNDSNKYGNRVHKDFEAYLRDGVILPPDLVKFQSLLDRTKAIPGEQFYELELAVDHDKKPCGYWDEDCWQRGKADVAIVNGKTGASIDWKTGKPKDDPDQMKLVSALMMSTFPTIESVSIKYAFIFHPQAPAETVTYTRDALPHLWSVFERRSAKMESALTAGVFKPKPSGLCPWCPAYNVCNYAKRRR